MRLVVLLAAAMILGGCSWLYQSPYEEALVSNRIPPPPGLGLR